MVEVKVAKPVNAFMVEDEEGLYKKVSSKVAQEHEDLRESLSNDDIKPAVRALVGSTLSWFIPFPK